MPIKNVEVSDGVNLREKTVYEPIFALVEGSTTGFAIYMTYCRAGGGVLDRFREPAHPVPSIYRFQFAAPGFRPKQIDGGAGELVEDLGKPSRERFSLRLPEVNLELQR